MSTKKNSSKKSAKSNKSTEASTSEQLVLSGETQGEALATSEATESREVITEPEVETVAQSDAPSARAQILGFVDTSIDHVEQRLGAIGDGEKLSMQTLCAEIAATTGVPKERIYVFVSMYVNRRAGFTVARGREGGIYKGARPSKALAPEQVEKLQKRAEATEKKALALVAEAAKLRERAGAQAAA